MSFMNDPSFLRSRFFLNSQFLKLRFICNSYCAIMGLKKLFRPVFFISAIWIYYFVIILGYTVILGLFYLYRNFITHVIFHQFLITYVHIFHIFIFPYFFQLCHLNCIGFGGNIPGYLVRPFVMPKCWPQKQWPTLQYLP